MKILLLSIGTRGDCEPFVGVGEMLRQHGEEVLCAFPEQYRNTAEENGFHFHSLGSEYLDLLNGYFGQASMCEKGFKRIKALIELTKQSIPIQKRLLDAQKAIIEETNPDVIIYHPKAAYPLIWSLNSGKKSILLMPVPYVLHKVNDMPHIGIGGKMPVNLSYKLAQYGYVRSIMTAVNRFFKGKYTPKQINAAMLASPAFYTVSPSMFKRPEYWGNHIIVAGFWERNKTANWTPSPELSDFLDRHKKIVLITFGSMTNLQPKEKTDTFIEVLEECNIPAILNISGGGLARPDKPYNKDLIFFTDSIPYDWAFPKMYAVIHHGGAGTLHSALKAGCATMVIPHIGDQPMWNELVGKLGAGPSGIPVSKLNRASLSVKLKDLYINPSYKEKAETIAKNMREENFSDRLFQFITG
jgi:UDP:flavonoid glycosyltransferase YjiC (YdhE family)